MVRRIDINESNEIDNLVELMRKLIRVERKIVSEPSVNLILFNT